MYASLTLDFLAFTFTDKPRVGICSQEGKALGFVFIEMTSLVSSLREAITEEVGGIQYTHTLFKDPSIRD